MKGTLLSTIHATVVVSGRLMDLGIEGKNVLITGASRGLGRAAAVAFAKEGAHVGVIART